ncbi:MAG TPA: hypothetical protein VNK44_06605 [Candidatus Nitrosotenuis sp.]|nr:hypothetical protein [Candidatus Nitrosotenuis sp.]
MAQNLTGMTAVEQNTDTKSPEEEMVTKVRQEKNQTASTPTSQ